MGVHIPNLDVTDSNGQRQSFETLRGPKGLVLLFARSADWSRPCQTQIIDLDRHAPEFRRKGLGVAAITYDSVTILQNLAEKQKIAIPLLSDSGSQTIKAFGLLNTNIDPANAAFGVPFPGTFILDERGIVTAKYFDDDPAERFSAGAILTHELMPDLVLSDVVFRKVLDLPQATVSWSASDSTVSPGSRITLIVDIDPKPKMHILAPGSQGYIPVDWEMGTSKAWISFPLGYPSSRSMPLPAINETLPIYDRHIRLFRDLAIGQENEIAPSLTPDRNLSAEGSFRFQACDDKECLPPRSILLRWNVKVAQP